VVMMSVDTKLFHSTQQNGQTVPKQELFHSRTLYAED